MNNSKKPKIRTDILNKYGGRCAYCGTELTLQTLNVDHIQPKWRSYSKDHMKTHYGIEKGDDSIENLNPSCKTCNISKSTFSIEQWRQQIENKVKILLRDSSTFRIALRYDLISITGTGVEFYFEKFNKNNNHGK